MRCPFCNGRSTKVLDTRETSDNEIRRRRECSDCEERFTTYERVESPSLVVIKQGEREEEFSRQKILEGITKACSKRPVSEEQMEDIADRVESRIRAKNVRKVDSKEIGQLVLERLKELDEVAYIRFASVYRSFEDADSFEKELKELKKA